MLDRGGHFVFFVSSMYYDRLASTGFNPSVPIPDEEKRLSYICIFTLLCGASKGFMKAIKGFIKPLKAPERSVKIKI